MNRLTITLIMLMLAISLSPVPLSASADVYAYMFSIPGNPVLADYAFDSGEALLLYKTDTGAAILYTGSGTFINISLDTTYPPLLEFIPYNDKLFLLINSITGNYTTVYLVELSTSLTTYSYTLPEPGYHVPSLVYLYDGVLQLDYYNFTLFIDLVTRSGTLYNGSVTYSGNYYVTQNDTIDVYDSDWNYVKSYILQPTGGDIVSGPYVRNAFIYNRSLHFLFDVVLVTSGPIRTEIGLIRMERFNGTGLEWIDMINLDYLSNLVISAKSVGDDFYMIYTPQPDMIAHMYPAYSSLSDAASILFGYELPALAVSSGGMNYISLGGWVFSAPATSYGPSVMGMFSVIFRDVEGEYRSETETGFVLSETTRTDYALPSSSPVSLSTDSLTMSTSILSPLPLPYIDQSEDIIQRYLVYSDGSNIIINMSNSNWTAGFYDVYGSFKYTINPGTPVTIPVSDGRPYSDNITLLGGTILFYNFNGMYYPLVADYLFVSTINETTIVTTNGWPLSYTANETGIYLSVNGSKNLGTDLFPILGSSIISVPIPDGYTVTSVTVDGNPTTKYTVHNGFLVVDPEFEITARLASPTSMASMGGPAESLSFKIPVLLTMTVLGLLVVWRSILFRSK